MGISVRSVTSAVLAKSLQLKVIAEGVETDAPARLMGLLTCDEIQGYLISPALDCPARTSVARRPECRALYGFAQAAQVVVLLT